MRAQNNRSSAWRASAKNTARIFFGLGCSFVSGWIGCAASPEGEQLAAYEPGEELPGGDTTNSLMLGQNAFKRDAANITSEHAAWFATGNAFFNAPWVEAPSSTSARDGLGPLFNARSCAACHLHDGRGHPPLGPNELAPEDAFLGLLLRIGTGQRTETGAPEGDPIYGGQLQPHATPNIPAEGTPRVRYEVVKGQYADGEPYELLKPEYSIEAPGYSPLPSGLRISARVAPIMVGLGLLEAISEARLVELSDPEDADGDGISGKINKVWDAEHQMKAIGRFGWKAEQPSVRAQVAGAFVDDMGITSSVFSGQPCTSAQTACNQAINGGSPELSDKLLGRVEAYSQLLAVPARPRFKDEETLRGKKLFHDAGCASCHVPSHRTGESKLAEFTNQTIWPYTDLLLHDMGEELSDQRPAFEAEGSEWRTPPLWGIGRIPDVNRHQRLLHDGRARGVAEAILWHGGEAQSAAERFKQLSSAERRLLVRFVESL